MKGARPARELSLLPLLRGAARFGRRFVISAVIQLGLMPLLVNDFHRVGIIGLLANIPAVLLTAVIVPLGFASRSP